MKYMIIIMLALSGCYADASELDSTGICDAQNLQHLIGQKEAVLDNMDLREPYRILHPGDIITMDYSPDRLTINIDENGLISRVSCQ